MCNFNPCKDCKKRTAECHDRCNDYFKFKLDIIDNKISREKWRENQYNNKSYTLQNYYKQREELLKNHYE